MRILALEDDKRLRGIVNSYLAECLFHSLDSFKVSGGLVAQAMVYYLNTMSHTYSSRYNPLTSPSVPFNPL